MEREDVLICIFVTFLCVFQRYKKNVNVEEWVDSEYVRKQQKKANTGLPLEHCNPSK